AGGRRSRFGDQPGGRRVGPTEFLRARGAECLTRTSGDHALVGAHPVARLLAVLRRAGGRWCGGAGVVAARTVAPLPPEAEFMTTARRAARAIGGLAAL